MALPSGFSLTYGARPGWNVAQRLAVRLARLEAWTWDKHHLRRHALLHLGLALPVMLATMLGAAVAITTAVLVLLLDLLALPYGERLVEAAGGRIRRYKERSDYIDATIVRLEPALPANVIEEARARVRKGREASAVRLILDELTSQSVAPHEPETLADAARKVGMRPDLRDRLIALHAIPPEARYVQSGS